MLKKNICLYIFLYIFFIYSCRCFCQISCAPGDNIQFCINNFINSETTIENISFLICNSNDTVFYIDSIKINDIFIVNMQKDYLTTNCLFENIDALLDLKTVDLYIYGTGLSGNDTITNISLTNILYDNKSLKDTSFYVICKNQNFINNYAKFAKISSIYPSVVSKSSDLFVEYSVDISSDITFRIFNESGIELYRTNYYKPKLGKDKLIINSAILSNFCVGKYWIFLETSSGINYQTFILINQ